MKSGVCWDLGEGEGCAEPGRASEGLAGRHRPRDSGLPVRVETRATPDPGKALKGENPCPIWVFGGERIISDAQSPPPHTHRLEPPVLRLILGEFDWGVG